MATITTINDSDLISASNEVINTNFTNLNTDKIETSYLDTDTSLTANSDTKVATQKAVKAYVDSGGGALDASTTVKGITRLSAAPTVASVPIAVGDNDYRVVGYAADSGSNDTYAITLSPAPTAYTTGMVVKFKANTINTGAATLNCNSLGAKTIVKYVNTTLADGDIAAGMLCTVIYDGTNFVLQNPVANAPLTSVSGILGAWTSATADGNGHQVTKDGFLIGYWTDSQNATGSVTIKTDSASTPTTIAYYFATGGSGMIGVSNSFCVPVRKNEYYSISTTGTYMSINSANFIPLGS